MWSDKTSWLIRQFGRGENTLAFKPTLDTRYTKKAVLKSHTGREIRAYLIDVKQPEKILKLVKKYKTVKVILDEINFFNEKLVEVIKELLEQSVDVYAAGLLLDSERRPFGATPQLLSLADEVVESFASCDYFAKGERCQKKAKYTYAKIKKEKQLVVGAADLYGAACEDHYDLLQNKAGNLFSWYERVHGSVWGKLITNHADWLKTIQLPYERRPLDRKARKFPRIEIGADSMRVGKTTAVSVISEGLKKLNLPVTVSLEDWQHNPYLTKSYRDPSKGLLQSQKWFVKRKHDQILAGDQRKIMIQDVHPEMDFAYAFTNALMDRLSVKQFNNYLKFYQSLKWPKVAAPDLLIYLTASDEVLISRARKSARKFEKVQSKYFLLMKAVNRVWVLGADYIKVLMIDTDRFDFSKNGQVKKALIERVVKVLRKQGWQL